MIPLIITIIIFLIFSSYIIANVIQDIVYIIINLVILWVILLRSYFEIRYKKILYPYLIGLGITTILNLLWFDKIQIPKVFWPVLFLSFLFLIAQLIQFLEPFYKRYKLDQLFSKKSKK